MAASVKKQPKKRMSRAARKEAITGYLLSLITHLTLPTNREV